MEVSSSARRRTQVTFILPLSWGAGVVVSVAIAIFLRNWRPLLLACAAMVALTVPIAYWLPESPRWLLAQRRYKRAHQVMQRAASVSRREPLALEELEMHVEAATTQTTSYGELLRQPALWRRTGALALAWLCVTLVAFGVFFYGTMLTPQSAHLTGLVLGSLKVAAAYPLVVLFRHFGRRPLLLFLLALAALLLIPLALISQSATLTPWLVSILVGLAQIAIGGVLDGLFLLA